MTTEPAQILHAMRLPAAERQALQKAWSGRRRHTIDISRWIQKMRAQCEHWPDDGLTDETIAGLVKILPNLSRSHHHLFDVSVDLLRAQNPDKAWQRALNLRVAMIRRAGDKRYDLTGDRILLAPRRNSWRATLENDGNWVMHDGRSLTEFLNAGRKERTMAWRAASTLPRVASIELPAKHLGGAAWAKALKDAGRWLASSHPELKAALASGRTWHLAVRRIKILGARGAFDAPSQTIVVDPRHPKTLKHELAHWVLDHDASVKVQVAEREVEILLAQS